MKYLFEINCFTCKVTSFVGYDTEAESENIPHGTLGSLTRESAFVHCPVCDLHIDAKGSVPKGTVERVKEAWLRDWKAEASHFLNDNKKVAAIKACREITKWSLREAKAQVEALEAHSRMKLRAV